MLDDAVFYLKSTYRLETAARRPQLSVYCFAISASSETDKTFSAFLSCAAPVKLKDLLPPERHQQESATRHGAIIIKLTYLISARKVLVAAIFLAPIEALAQAPLASEHSLGRQIALEQCGTCHRVTAGQLRPAKMFQVFLLSLICRRLPHFPCGCSFARITTECRT